MPRLTAEEIREYRRALELDPSGSRELRAAFAAISGELVMALEAEARFRARITEAAEKFEAECKAREPERCKSCGGNPALCDHPNFKPKRERVAKRRT